MATKKSARKVKGKKQTRDTADATAFLDKLINEPLTFGSLIATIRAGEEMSQAEFAAKLGISRSHLCDIERAAKTVSPARAAKFARSLGYPEAQFVRLALQAQIEDAGLKLVVSVAAG